MHTLNYIIYLCFQYNRQKTKGAANAHIKKAKISLIKTVSGIMSNPIKKKTVQVKAGGGNLELC